MLVQVMLLQNFLFRINGVIPSLHTRTQNTAVHRWEPRLPACLLMLESKADVDDIVRLLYH